ncbi:Polyol:NADP oxidoreductase [Hartmannibacter diazotrophicus]|uniref:Polyol:NADP oxidoreductase n=1 Tax=Hartmannibacter diazotrophicus TaxID=1482074 RepID=A0A2C9DDA3_9HYPH|nr:mannitol dehydrogenase family protein [Hartmannibacter diazotrophicus]SON58150.1 Polyol:NADP oxidoreductase [Hartmannibacter diazotrophicus]
MPAERLSRSTAPRPGVGIVHLGLGAFFRAHGAIYVTEAMAASGGDWGIVGVSLKSPTMRDALKPQGCAYTAVELGPSGETAQTIEVIEDVLVAREDPEAVLDLMADPRIRIVTLTVTEKGYCHEPATGALNLAHPDIVHDIAEPLPVSAPGFLVRALQRRKKAGHRPFTVLTCDNLPENGRVVRGVVLALARAIDPGLADWIEREGRFPSTMVDRIVPATTDADIARVEQLTGRHDALPVLHEPFRQWVVEDNFVDGARPDLAAAGVELVEDVTPFEHMKLRMLNGTHSSLAYLGYLAGHETISETVADPAFAAYVKGLWRDEIIPALEAPPGVDLAAYADALFKRYANPAIRHRTWQIAMDGSQKLPQRILGTLATNLDAGRPSPGLCLAVAAWMRYVGGTDEKGEPIDVRDPLAARLKALCDATDDPDTRVRSLLAVEDVFPPALADRLAGPIIAAYRKLRAVGARGALLELTGVAS